MRLVVQRVRKAAVSWRDEDGTDQRRTIDHGLAILIGAGPNDNSGDAERLAEKLANLRIFADAEGRTNLSLKDVNGQALVVSQFTLYADLSRGRRPSFIRAGDPNEAEKLYLRFVETLAEQGIDVQTGSFGAQMIVSLDNDGPVTLALSTDDWNTRV